MGVSSAINRPSDLFGFGGLRNIVWFRSLLRVSSEDFVEHVQPRIGVADVGRRNCTDGPQFSHPFRLVGRNICCRDDTSQKANFPVRFEQLSGRQIHVSVACAVSRLCLLPDGRDGRFGRVSSPIASLKAIANSTVSGIPLNGETSGGTES